MQPHSSKCLQQKCPFLWLHPIIKSYLIPYLYIYRILDEEALRHITCVFPVDMMNKSSLHVRIFIGPSKDGGLVSYAAVVICM